ncbi:MAG TPA: ComEC/Rec2 family competence protein, partial [Planctomycetaceae bacterium]|nr:ComEC/Rec2 family competence protein [Planctomycetaceae bacterium]
MTRRYSEHPHAFILTITRVRPMFERDLASDPQSQRAPAVPVVAACALGIVVDRCTEWPLHAWLPAAAVLCMAWLVAFMTRRPWPAAVCLLAAVAALGGAWHHLGQFTLAGDDIFLFTREEPRFARLTGTVVDEPTYRMPKQHAIPSAVRQKPRTIVTVHAEKLHTPVGDVRVSGRVRVEAPGIVEEVHPGDPVSVVGSLTRPSPPLSRGAFDFRAILRESGIRAIVRSTKGETLTRNGPSPSIRLTTWRSALQQRAIDVLEQSLSKEMAPVAVAMLLGPRTEISRELREDFQKSGTMHFLAISGLNVGIFAIFVWLCCRLVRLPPWCTSLAMAVGVTGYWWITDGGPPVLRATVLLLVWLLGQACGRLTSSLNLLAVALLVVVVVKPVDLFGVSAQLSFLAVAALIWAANVPRAEDSEETLDRLAREQQAWWQRGLWWCLAHVRESYRLTLAVWLVTLPLMGARFYLVSPVALAVNILITPFMTVTMWFGYALLLCGSVAPWLGLPFAFGFERCLRLFQWIVEQSARVPGGHFEILGIYEWWLIGFYAGLAVALLTSPRWRGWGWRVAWAWCLVGLTWGLWDFPGPDLRCRFLPVGHGGAILCELPSGQTLLYDAGSLQDPDRAEYAIRNAMHEAKLSRIDALVISHADVDHFNAVPGLLETGRIGAIYVSPTFLDFGQSSVRTACDRAVKAKVPVRLLWKGDRLRNNSSATIEVLHPKATGRYPDDNANSIVLRIEYGGRS